VWNEYIHPVDAESARRQGVDFGGLHSQTKLQAPPNWNMKHYKSFEFLSIFRVLIPPTQTQSPAETQSPATENFRAMVLCRSEVL